MHLGRQIRAWPSTFHDLQQQLRIWIQINAGKPPPPQLIQAYAYSGQNFKWAISSVRSRPRWIHEPCLFSYGTGQAQKALSSMRAIQWTGNETVAEMMATVEAATGGKEAVAFAA